jgi:phosphoserine phosphatase RsbU/P
MPGWRRLQHALWDEVSTKAFVIFTLAVGCTFASMGFLLDLKQIDRPFSGVFDNAILSGLLAMAYAVTLTRYFRWLPAAFLLHIAAIWLMSGSSHREPFTALAGATLQDRLRYDMLGAIACIILGYTGFVLFIAREGRRWVAVHAEMRLARDIHQALVPRIDRRIGRFAFYGVSLPSGQVGGDLVDLVTLRDGRWMAYVADVAGHGVSSGLLMGMVKSGIRMRVADPPPLPALLSDLNHVICDQSAPHMFVTLAAIRGGGEAAPHDDDELEFTLAGHPPILRASSGRSSVEEIAISHVPLGVMPDWTFGSATIRCRPGDVLALVTDGLFEVFDAQDRDFGLDGIKAVLDAFADRPLQEIADRLVERARAFGPQLDDQTVLLVRCD